MPRRNAFNSWEQTGDNQPPSPVDLIAAQKKKQRDRSWEKVRILPLNQAPTSTSALRRRLVPRNLP